MLSKLVISQSVTQSQAAAVLVLTSLPNSAAATAAAAELNTYGGPPWHGEQFWPFVERVLGGLDLTEAQRLRVGSCLVSTALEAGVPN